MQSGRAAGMGKVSISMVSAMVALASALPVFGVLLPMEYNTVVDGVASNITFSFTLNRAPEFNTLDDQNRQYGSFQVWFDADDSSDPWADGDYIIRGSEIHIGGDIPIRARTGVGGPDSSGWGPVADSVAYSTLETNVSFVVPFASVGESDGSFTYGIMFAEYGDEQFQAVGEDGRSYVPDHTVEPIPEPSVLLLMALAGAAIVLFRNRSR
jgi:hypothetical protein